jgi:hypothetical protein
MKHSLKSLVKINLGIFNAVVISLGLTFSHLGYSSDLGYFAVLSTEESKRKYDPEVINTLRSFVKNDLLVDSTSYYAANRAIPFDIELLLENIKDSSHKHAAIYIAGPAEVTSNGCALVFPEERLMLDDVLALMQSAYSTKISLYLDLRIESDGEKCETSLKDYGSPVIYYSDSGHENINYFYKEDDQTIKPSFSDLSLSIISSFIDFSSIKSFEAFFDVEMNHKLFLSDFLVNSKNDNLYEIKLIEATNSTVFNKYHDFYTSYALPFFKDRAELLTASIKEEIIKQAARERAAREQVARDQAAREQAARDQAAREQAAREQAARDQAARDKAAREQGVREQVAREQAERDQVAREQAAKDQAVRDQAAKDQAARDQAARDQAARDQAARDQAARDKAARDKAARDKAARDQAARDQAARDQAARDQAARDQAARDQAARDQAARDQAAREKDALDKELDELIRSRKKNKNTDTDDLPLFSF